MAVDDGVRLAPSLDVGRKRADRRVVRVRRGLLRFEAADVALLVVRVLVVCLPPSVALQTQSYFKSPRGDRRTAGEKAGSRFASASLAYVCGLGGPLRASKTRAKIWSDLLASVLQATSQKYKRAQDKR